MISKSPLEEFIKNLIEHVRDSAISNLDILCKKNAKSISAVRWRKKASNTNPIEFAVEIIPDCVDATIFFLLKAIEDGDLKLHFETKSGKITNIEKLAGSEMAGRYIGLEDWIRDYSKERISGCASQ